MENEKWQSLILGHPKCELKKLDSSSAKYRTVSCSNVTKSMLQTQFLPNYASDSCREAYSILTAPSINLQRKLRAEQEARSYRKYVQMKAERHREHNVKRQQLAEIKQQRQRADQKAQWQQNAELNNENEAYKLLLSCVLQQQAPEVLDTVKNLFRTNRN